MLNNNQGGGIDLTGTRSFAQFGGAAGVQQNANAGFQMGGASRSPFAGELVAKSVGNPAPIPKPVAGYWLHAAREDGCTQRRASR